MTLSSIDRSLLERCLARTPRAWEDFVDRFLGLVVHVVQHTARSRNLVLDKSTQDDLVADVFLTLIKEDFAVLRKFRQQSSLATFLTVVARRVAVRRIAQQKRSATVQNGAAFSSVDDASSDDSATERFDDREQVEQLLQTLPEREAQVVRLFHLEGLSYREIHERTGVSENTIGPMLSQARNVMRTRSR